MGIALSCERILEGYLRDVEVLRPCFVRDLFGILTEDWIPKSEEGLMVSSTIEVSI